MNMDLSLISDIRVIIRVRIGKTTMTLSEISSLKTTDTIVLDQLSNDPLDIVVGDIVIGKGEIVVKDGNFGIKITSIGSVISQGTHYE